MTDAADPPASGDDPPPSGNDPTPTPTRHTPGRTWPQRFTIGGVIALAIASFAAAGVLATGQWVVSNRNLVVLDNADASNASGGDTIVVTGNTADGADADGDPTADTGPSTTEVPFPSVEPDAKNFLVTGADGNACVSTDSRFAGAFGDVHQFGDRSDTIMVWRVNPGSGQIAVLSFPRDLYVDIGNRKGRINEAYRRDDPERLISTLDQNFDIGIDHYVQVDFCAFKRLVDAVGGVEVPFEYPARDSRTGLDVPEVGCFNFEGEHALAYVRSRRYQYEDPVGSGNWKTDGTSDLGRIARQQDFLRRTVSSVLSAGYSPSVLSALIETNREYLTIDTELTVNRMLGFAGALRSLDGDSIASYQIESVPRTVAGNSVLIPTIDGGNMQAILAVFRGEATLAEAPEQEFDATSSVPDRPDQGSTTTTTTSTTPTTVPDADDTDAGGDDGDGVPTATLPEVEADENLLGISPPRDVTC